MTTLSSGTILQSAIRSPLNITGSGVELARLQLDSIAITLSGSGHHIHGCTFTGTSTLTVNSDCHDTVIEYNTFRTVSNAPVRGTPGNNITVRYNDVDVTNANTSGLDNDEEWLHFVSPCNGLSIIGNVIRGNRLRWAIELQTGMSNLKVQGNWIHAAQGGSGISCATGGEATPPFTNAGCDIDISGNTVLSDAALGCALEIDGDRNIRVHDNYFSGFLTSIVNGTGGQRGQGLMTSTNVLVYVTNPYADGDNTPWVVPPRTSANDRVFKIGTAGVPAPPPAPISVGAAYDGRTTVIAPSNVLNQARMDGSVVVTWTDSTGGRGVPTIYIFPTRGSTSPLKLGTLAAGMTTATIANIPDGWEVTPEISLTMDGVESSLVGSNVQVTGGPISDSAFSPTLAVAPLPVPNAALSATIIADLGAVDKAQATLVAALSQLEGDLKAGK